MQYTESLPHTKSEAMHLINSLITSPHLKILKAEMGFTCNFPGLSPKIVKLVSRFTITFSLCDSFKPQPRLTSSRRWTQMSISHNTSFPIKSHPWPSTPSLSLELQVKSPGLPGFCWSLRSGSCVRYYPIKPNNPLTGPEYPWRKPPGSASPIINLMFLAVIKARMLPNCTVYVKYLIWNQCFWPIRVPVSRATHSFPQKRLIASVKNNYLYSSLLL